MLSRGIPNAHAFRTGRLLAVFVAVLALIVGTGAPAFAASGPAVGTGSVQTMAGPVKASLVGFAAGNIISDAVFTNRSTMTEAQIQAFFDSKVKTCQGGADKYGPIVCLKDYRTDSANRAADAYCKGYTGAKGESAARIIYRVSQSCGINPQVLIVMLQKEQGLVTHTWPSAWRYDAALGQGCPDDAACNPKYVGFFQQIYGAARQLQTYMEGRYFTWYAPGKTWNILYNPNRGCGTSPVLVSNKATSALYYYTPYQPNAAALRAGYGLGDSCSSYGNRNFYNYFTDWFGSTQKAPAPSPAFTMGTVSMTGKPLVGQTLRAVTKISPKPASLAYQWYRNDKAVSGATGSAYALTDADRSATVKVRVTARTSGYTTGTATSGAVRVKAVTTSRLSGDDRIATAVKVSRAAWPTGTKTVMLTTSRDFPDALSAAAAAGRASGSLLLTTPRSLSPATAAEIKRLNPTRIVLIGGEGVMSRTVASQAAAVAPGAKVTRVAGADRYATSRAVAQMGGASSRVLLATGRDFPDAISAAAAGNSIGAPVLLVNTVATQLDVSTLATIKKVGATRVTIVGGTGVIPSTMFKQLQQQGLTVNRLSGASRYETNAAVAKAFFPTTALKVLLASGQDYPDALTGSVLAGRWRVPLLLTRKSCVAPGAADYMVRTRAESAVLIGGPAVLDDGVARLRRC